MKTNLLKFKTNGCIALVVLALTIGACSSDDGPGNQAPHKVSVINPSNSTKDIDVSAIELQWTAAIDPNDDAVTYDVYLDTFTPPVNKVKSGISELNLKLQDDLDFGKTYYWSVKAVDESGAESSSDIASFTTRELTTEEQIVGRWFIESITVNGIREATDQCTAKSYFEFTDDGKSRIVIYRTGDPCTIKADQSFVYQITNTGTLVLNSATGSSGFLEIVILTETDLELMYDDEVQYNLVREQ